MKNLFSLLFALCVVGLVAQGIVTLFAQVKTVGPSGGGSGTATNLSGGALEQVTNIANTVVGGATNRVSVFTPGVTNVASAATIIIDLSNTNAPLVTMTNAAAHNISLVVSNPAPGRWFTFYGAGNGGVTTNNAATWSGVAGVLLKWMDAATNTTIYSNGWAMVSGYIAMTAPTTNLLVSYRDE